MSTNIKKAQDYKYVGSFAGRQDLNATDVALTLNQTDNVRDQGEEYHSSGKLSIIGMIFGATLFVASFISKALIANASVAATTSLALLILGSVVTGLFAIKRICEVYREAQVRKEELGGEQSMLQGQGAVLRAGNDLMIANSENQAKESQLSTVAIAGAVTDSSLMERDDKEYFINNYIGQQASKFMNNSDNYKDIKNKSHIFGKHVDLVRSQAQNYYSLDAQRNGLLK